MSKQAIRELSKRTIYEILESLIIDESRYVEKLRIINIIELNIREHLKIGDNWIPVTSVGEIFSSVSAIYKFTKDLHDKLLQSRLQGIDHLLLHLGDVITHNTPFFKLYAQYIHQMKSSKVIFQDQYGRNSHFKKFIDLQQRVFDNIQLKQLLDEPQTHLPTYMVTLSVLLEKLSPEHPAYPSVETALSKMTEVMADIAQSAEHASRTEKVYDVQKTTLYDKVALVDPTRTWYFTTQCRLRDSIIEPARVNDGKLFIFNDILIFAKEGLFNRLSYHCMMNIAGLSVSPTVSNMCKLTSSINDRSWEITIVPPSKSTASTGGSKDSSSHTLQFYITLLKVYNLYYNINTTTQNKTVNTKIMHPDDHDKMIAKVPITGSIRMIDRPEYVPLDKLQEVVNSANKEKRAALRAQRGTTATGGTSGGTTSGGITAGTTSGGTSGGTVSARPAPPTPSQGNAITSNKPAFSTYSFGNNTQRPAPTPVTIPSSSSTTTPAALASPAPIPSRPSRPAPTPRRNSITPTAVDAPSPFAATAQPDTPSASPFTPTTPARTAAPIPTRPRGPSNPFAMQSTPQTPQRSGEHPIVPPRRGSISSSNIPTPSACETTTPVHTPMPVAPSPPVFSHQHEDELPTTSVYDDDVYNTSQYVQPLTVTIDTPSPVSTTKSLSSSNEQQQQQQQIYPSQPTTTAEPTTIQSIPETSEPVPVQQPSQASSSPAMPRPNFLASISSGSQGLKHVDPETTAKPPTPQGGGLLAGIRQGITLNRVEAQPKKKAAEETMLAWRKFVVGESEDESEDEYSDADEWA